MALIAFLALAIMTYVRSETRNSDAAADLIEARVLADLPEKLVISQIRRATHNLGSNYTWASQPGMIRVFGTNPSSIGPRAAPEFIYKLYSAEDMILDSSDPKQALDREAQTLSQVNWATDRDPTKPATVAPVYADLNEPSTVQPEQRLRDTPNQKTGTLIYPIVDPTVIGKVDGFSVGNQSPPRTLAHPFPMPARWLYVLRDGTLCIATGGSKVRLVSATSSGDGPSETNPVVGRIAFWTDDDSCKLNVNTASEPAPWDTPHTRTTRDEDYAKSIPAAHEFYRLSGHPAFTSLAPTLRFMLSNDASIDTPLVREPQTPLNSGPWARHIEDWLDMFPRSPKQGTGTLGGTLTPTSEAEPRQFRLFASLDDFYFTTGSSSQPQRVRNGQGSQAPKLTENKLRATNFFLTTHNRAPELNPFNAPKISLWPVSADAGQRSKLDQQMCQAATVGGHEYFLRRFQNWTAGSAGSAQSQDDDSGQSQATTQRNFDLYQSLVTASQTAIPGFVGSFVGNGGRYSPDSCDQFLLSMFDMIRWGVNSGLQSQTTSTSSYLAPATDEGGSTALPLRMQGVGEVIPSTLTSQTPNQWVKSFGRFPVITQVALVLTTTEVEINPTTGQPLNADGYPLFADHSRKLQAFIVVEPYCISPGAPSVSPSWLYSINGLANLTITGSAGTVASLNFPTSATNSVRATTATNQSGGSPWLGLVGQFTQANGAPKAFPYTTAGAQPDEDRDFAITSKRAVDLTSFQPPESMADSKLSFNGGNITIEIKDNTTGNLVQVVEVNLPPATIPMPLMSMANQSLVVGVPLATQMQHRFTPVKKGAAGPMRMSHLIYRGDVVKAVEFGGVPNFGDVRMMAAHNHILAAPATASPPQRLLTDSFHPHPLYPANNPAADEYAHNLRDLEATRTATVLGTWDAGNEMPAAPSIPPGLLVKFQNHLPVLPPAIYDGKAPPSNFGFDLALGSIPPVNISGAVNGDLRPGDFNNGPGIIEDGPYISTPDVNTAVNEANAGTTTGTTSGWFQRGGDFKDEDGISFNPLRQASSAFIFGSLPTGIFGTATDPFPPTTPGALPRPRPWQTLLLCPNPPSRTTPPDQEPDWVPPTTSNFFPNPQDHFGFAEPRDHLWLEFFRMPAVDPPGTADAVSTEGKVNMNYEIRPFTWIKRATAMHGALNGIRLTAIPTSAVKAGTSDHYKDPSGATGLEFRYGINAPATLEAFDDMRFDQGDIFRSPSEICEMWLVPQRLVNDGNAHQYSAGSVDPPLPPGNNTTPSTYTTQKTGDYTHMLEWWEADPAKVDDAFEATGDNLRESPYAQLYPRLTTRSNVFTIHYRVQVVRKARSVRPDEWDESKDTITAEQRGSTTVERYLDLNETKPMPDFATSGGQALDEYYKTKVLSRRVFAP